VENKGGVSRKKCHKKKSENLWNMLILQKNIN